MMEDFLKLLSKKAREQGGPKMDRHMSAKAAMAKELSDVLGEDLAEGIKGVKKVTVASDSSSGLEKGLEKAREMLHSKEKESEEDMDQESMDEENMDEEEMGEEESDDVESQIAKLEQQIKALKRKSK